MKCLIDNNLPPSFAKALTALSVKEEIKVFSLREKFKENALDTEWIAELSKEKDWFIISSDRFNKSLLEKEALRQSGITAFILAKGWQHIGYWEQAWSLVRWWPSIIGVAKKFQGGAILEVPKQFSGAGKFKQIKL